MLSYSETEIYNRACKGCIESCLLSSDIFMDKGLHNAALRSLMWAKDLEIYKEHGPVLCIGSGKYHFLTRFSHIHTKVVRYAHRRTSILGHNGLVLVFSPLFNTGIRDELIRKISHGMVKMIADFSPSSLNFRFQENLEVSQLAPSLMHEALDRNDVYTVAQKLRVALGFDEDV